MIDDFKWNHLTGCESYTSNKKELETDIASVISKQSCNKIDPVAVLSVLMKNYPIGDRTLISGITKHPWMVKFKENCKIDATLPSHGSLSLSENEVSDKLILLMKKEALRFIDGKKSIGILLSGGMDSRIIAAIIKNLQSEGLYTGEVTALTWGIEDCRDVLYAKKIADDHQWSFKHFLITPNTLLNNIYLAGERGAEYSPVHLHAMSDIAKITDLDGILAGSYGDSIGRGEYSGKKVNELPLLLGKHLNHYSFLSREVERKAIKSLQQDVADSRSKFPGRTENSYREIEMQMHYMRRQLNSCMSVIGEKIPLYQMFTCPSVFGFMWSLSANCRTDAVYEKILQKLSVELLAIPWARDGKIYNSRNSESLDNHNKSYHRYGDWLRNEHREFISGNILSGNLQKVNIFNERSLEYWCKNWRKDSRPKVDRLDEKMAWLASLSIFIEKYNVKGGGDIKKSPISDEVRLYTSIIYEKTYYNAMKIMGK